MTDDPLMAIAWRDFLLFAIGNDEIRAQYTADTGRKFLPPATSPIDRLIDEATGARAGEVADFVLWATARIWGVDEAPEKVREAIAKSPYAEKGAD